MQISAIIRIHVGCVLLPGFAHAWYMALEEPQLNLGLNKFTELVWNGPIIKWSVIQAMILMTNYMSVIKIVD